MKILCLDIDGTLFNSQKKISEKTKEGLLDFQKKGNRIILASGRPTQGLMHIAHALEMEKYNGLLISYNGSQVYDLTTNEVVFNQAISIEDSKKVIHHCKQFDQLRIMVDYEDSFYVEDVYDCMIQKDGKPFNIIQYEAREGHMLLKEVWDLEDFVYFPINKILTTADPSYLQEHYQEISKPFKENLNSMFTADFYYEFTAKDIDKAKALSFIQEKYGLDSKDMIAFGDGQNDQTMLQFAKVGVAMENAVESLKEVADFVTKSCDEDGIIYALEELL